MAMTIDQINQTLDNDPQLQALRQQLSQSHVSGQQGGGYGSNSAQIGTQIRNRIAELGITPADGMDFVNGRQTAEGNGHWWEPFLLVGLGIAAAPFLGAAEAAFPAETAAATASAGGEAAATAIPSGLAASLPSEAGGILGTEAAAGTDLATTAIPGTAGVSGLTAGGPTVAGLAPSGAVGGSNVLSQFGDALKSPNALSSIGKMVSSATTASQANQRGDANITQNALAEDAVLEDRQRKSALADIFRQSFTASGSHSPYDKTPPVPSAAYLAALSNLQQQGSARLAAPPKYSTDNFPSPQSYTASTPGQTVGTYLGPALQILGQIPWGSL